MEAAVKVLEGLEGMFCCPFDSSIVWSMQSNETLTSVKDRGNSCVVVDKRLFMTRHVGDSVSMVTLVIRMLAGTETW